MVARWSPKPKTRVRFSLFLYKLYIFIFRILMKNIETTLVDPNNPNASELKLSDKEKHDILKALDIDNYSKECIISYKENNTKHKFIFILNVEDKKFKLIVDDDYAYHWDMKRAYDPDWKYVCLWWWKIEINEKKIRLFWDSGLYWVIPSETEKLIRMLLNKDHPDCNISWEIGDK